MYDAKAEAHEFLGDNSEDAIGKALSYFGVSREELTLKEYNEVGVSGLGGRALVVAQLTSAIGTIPSGGGGGDRDRGGRGGRDRDRGGRGRDRGDRDRGDRDRGDRDRGRGRDRERGRDRDRDRGASSAREDAPAEAAPMEDVGPSKGEAEGEIGPIGEFILGVIERMELGPFRVAKEAEEEKFIVLKVSGVAANGLTAGDGRTPDALQLLANQAAGQGDEDPKRIIVDVDGERGRRDDFLERVAERAAGRSEDTGRTVALEPMSPRDRRIIHIALREMEGIETMSRGEGRYRQVLVVPEGAAEYEEAKQAAAAPASDD